MRFLVRLLANAFALWCAAWFIDGIAYGGSWLGLLGLALVFGAVNTLVRPVLSFFSFPIQLLTLGLFTLVLNAFMLMLTAWLGARFDIPFVVDGFVAAFLGALLVTIVSTILNALFAPSEKDD